MGSKLLRRSLVLAVVVLAAACGGQGGGEQEGPTITIGAFDFPESEVLAQLYGQALEAEGYPVEVNPPIGAREVTQPALARGDIDFIVEYTGNALRFQVPGEEVDLRDPQEVYDALQESYADEDVVALEMSQAQDVDGVAVTRETAERYNLEKISDLAPVADELVFGAGPECPPRLSCLRGLEEVYGLEFKEFKELDVAGPITVAALKSGEVDVANLFTTQGVVAANDFVLLEDDRQLQLPQNIVPVVRNEVLEAYGDDFVNRVNAVTEQLTTEDLTEMNKRVEVDKEDPEVVARDWLEEHDLVS